MTNADRELLNQVKAVIETDIKVAFAERDPGLLTMWELTQAAIQSAQTFGRERRVVVERDPDHPNRLSIRFEL